MKYAKVLLLTNVISPYRIPVFNHLAVKAPVKFVFLQDMLTYYDLKVIWEEIKFNYQILKGKEISFPFRDLALHFNVGFVRLLLKENPDVIVSLGYTYLESIIGLIFAKVRNKKFVLWSGSTLKSSKSKNPFVKMIKKTVIRNCDAFLAYGSEAAEYLVHYGADRRSIIISCNTVDIDKFQYVSRQLINNRESIKAEYKMPARNILFVGRLVPCKNLLTLFNAFARLNYNDCRLTIVGDGDNRQAYESYCNENNIHNVDFKGYHDFDELINYYVSADVFVLPSEREIWGLVVNEAMACGLPVICSNRAGVAADLVKEGVNGYTFDPEDGAGLADKLKLLLDNDEKRKEMGRNSLQIIKKYTPEKYAEDVLKAVELANCPG